jgi:hypothetical protein
VQVTGGAHPDLGMEIPEEKFLNVFLGVVGHDPSLTQKANSTLSDKQNMN